MTAAFPLHWPNGRLRTAPASRRVASFGETGSRGYKQSLSVADARVRLQAQIDLLKARHVILSANIELRLDGQPRSGRPDPVDPGAALYFRLKDADFAFACDRWSTVADNIAAIAKHIEALRGIERWGVGTLEQAFAGYVALPASDLAAAQRPWWEVLDLPRTTSASMVEHTWRAKMLQAHPDRGGSHDRAAELNRARDEAMKELTTHA